VINLTLPVQSSWPCIYQVRRVVVVAQSLDLASSGSRGVRFALFAKLASTKTNAFLSIMVLTARTHGEFAVVVSIDTDVPSSDSAPNIPERPAGQRAEPEQRGFRGFSGQFGVFPGFFGVHFVSEQS
jgi:hypothetical protein